MCKEVRHYHSQTASIFSKILQYPLEVAYKRMNKLDANKQGIDTTTSRPVPNSSGHVGAAHI